MADYASHAFLVSHYAALAGSAKITTKYTTVAGQDKTRLIDFRIAANTKFSASQADHDIEIDLQSLGGLTYDRLVIPPGHNLGSAAVTVEVYSSASTPAGGGTIGTAVNPAAGSTIDIALTPSTGRYCRVKLNGTGQWELGELWLGQRLVPTTGVMHDWELPYFTPLLSTSFPTRDIVALLAAARRTYKLKHEALEDGSADELAYRTLATSGRGAPFYYWAPQASAVPFLARLRADLARKQDSRVPAAVVSYTVELDLIEQTS